MVGHCPCIISTNTFMMNAKSVKARELKICYQNHYYSRQRNDSTDELCTVSHKTEIVAEANSVDKDHLSQTRRQIRVYAVCVLDYKKINKNKIKLPP